jgi:hypothetical protein
LGRIKRFYPTAPFFAMHAAELLDRGLIEVSTAVRLDSEDNDGSPKILRVPRTVRECVWGTLEESDMYKLNRRAAELYFGS